MDWFCLFGWFCFNGDPNSISALALWGYYRISSLYGMGSLKTWVKGLFPKEKYCFRCCWKFWWHITELQCCWNGSDAGLAMLRCSEIMQNPWAVEVSHALLLGSQHGVQPVWEPALSSFGVHRLWEELLWGEPCEAFPSSSLKLCTLCSAACSKGGGGWFLRGHTSKSGISAWVRSTMGQVWLPDTSMVSQLSLWPADGVERILLFGSGGNSFS